MHGSVTAAGDVSLVAAIENGENDETSAVAVVGEDSLEKLKRWITDGTKGG